MKEKIVKFIPFVSLVLSILAVVYTYNLSASIDEIYQELEVIQLNNSNMNKGLDQKTLSKINNTINSIQQLYNQINILNKKIMFLETKINQKIKVEKNNLFFSKEVENILKKMNVNTEQTKKLANINSKNKLNINKQSKPEKKEKKKKNILKFNVYPPSIIYVMRIEKQGKKVFLYTNNGTIISKNSIYQGNFKIINIDLKNQYIILKNIEPNSYQYGRIYKIPFVLKIGNAILNNSNINNKPNKQNKQILNIE